jgi:hypothetical protein
VLTLPVATLGSHGNRRSMTCTFDNGEANATISEGCVHIEDLTDDPDVVLTRHTSQGDECGHYVNTIVCTAPNQTTGNPGCDCSTPDKCVVCAMQYHTVPSDNYDFSYDCSGRFVPVWVGGHGAHTIAPLASKCPHLHSSKHVHADARSPVLMRGSGSRQRSRDALQTEPTGGDPVRMQRNRGPDGVARSPDREGTSAGL